MERRTRALLLAGLLLVALNFRPSVTSVPPVLETIRADLGLSYTAASLLTTVPTVLMGLVAFAGAAVSRLLGRERAVLWAVLLIGAGTALRLWAGNVVVLFGTTVLVGVGIAISQALLPSIVGDHFPGRRALVTGLYTTSLGVGAAVAAGATAPLTEVLGSWPRALAVWSVLGLGAAAVWLPAIGEVESPTRETDRAGIPWGTGGAWVLTAFFSAETLLYYAELTWLAPLYVEAGWGAGRAGVLLTLFLVAQLVGSLVVPALADRGSDRRPWLGATVAMNVLGMAGIAWAPLAYPLAWATLAGFGLGAAFALCMTLPADHSADAGAADRLTAMMIGVGYVAGAAGPVVVGGVRDLSGSYVPAFLALVVLGVAMLPVTAWFRPDRTIL